MDNSKKVIYVSRDQYLMGRDKQPYFLEWTTLKRNNCVTFLTKLNEMLNVLAERGVEIPPLVVSSGYRPLAMNKKLNKAATHSYHLVCLACDFVGTDLYDVLVLHQDLLTKYGFWLEDKQSTPTWTHIDLGSRSKRNSRIFHA